MKKLTWRTDGLLPLLPAVALAGCAPPADIEAARPPGAAKTTALRFEVAVAPNLAAAAAPEGRLLVVLGRQERPEPRRTLGRPGLDASPVLGRDVAGLTPGAAVVVDQSAALFPLPHLADLPPGDYIVQAVLDTNRDLKSPN